MESLDQYKASLVNGTFYLIPDNSASITTPFDVHATNVTILEGEADVISGNYDVEITLLDSTIIIGQLVDYNRTMITYKFKGITISSTYKSFKKSDYPLFRIIPKDGKPIKFRLEYANGVEYSINTNIKTTEKEYTLDQSCTLRSNLPYNLKDLTGFIISFQGQERGSYRKRGEMIMLQSREMEVASASLVAPRSSNPGDDIGTPIDLGPIGLLSTGMSRIIKLETTKVSVKNYELEYDLYSTYASLIANVTSLGFVYPSQGIISAGNGLYPERYVDLTLEGEGVDFPLCLGKFPYVTIAKANIGGNVVELTISVGSTSVSQMVVKDSELASGDVVIPLKPNTTIKQRLSLKPKISSSYS